MFLFFSTNVFAFIEIEPIDTILKACGYGKTVDEAKNNALKNLSQQIVTEVKSEEELFRKRTQISGEKAKRYSEFKSKVKVRSIMLLKDIIYTKPKLENGQYKVCAYFTQKSLSSTISYLKETLSVKLINLSQDELKNLLVNAYYLLNLASFSEEKEKIKKFALNKINEIYNLLNSGFLVINTFPPNARIVINGKIFKSSETIVLPGDRTYIVKIEAEGYNPKTLNIYLGKGDRVSKTIELAKKVKKTLTVWVVSNISQAMTVAKEILAQSGFLISENPITNIALFIKVLDTPEKIDDYIKHNIKMIIKVYKGNTVCFTLTGRLKPFFTQPKNDKIIFDKKISKLTRAMINRLTNTLDINKCYTEEKYDYTPLLNLF